MQSPQMIQAMQILQLGALELEGRIEQELLENPVLELLDAAQAAGESQAGSEAPSPPDSPDEGPELPTGQSEMMDAVESMEWEYGEGRRSPGQSGGDEDAKYEAMQNTPDGPQHMAEVLAQDFLDLELSEEERPLVDFLLWSLDEHGYLRQGLTLLAEQMQESLGRPVDRLHLAEILQRLRQVTHVALGAKDLQDCLALQLEAQENSDPLMWALIENHLEDIQKNRLPAIAKATGASIEDIKAAMENLRHLDPFPGNDFGGEPAASITPDIMVEEEEGEFIITLARGRGGRLAINEEYTDMLAEKGAEKEVKIWVRKHVDQAQWFIDALKQRLTTLERVAQRVFSHQESFLREGLEGLRPLRMQEVADELSVHISTISRTVAGQIRPNPPGHFSPQILLHRGHGNGFGNRGQPSPHPGAGAPTDRWRGQEKAPLGRGHRQGAGRAERHPNRPPHGNQIPQGPGPALIQRPQRVLEPYSNVVYGVPLGRPNPLERVGHRPLAKKKETAT